MAIKKKNAFAELSKQIKGEMNALAFYRGEYSPVLDKAQRIVAELAKVRMTSPMLRFNRPAADESVKAVDRCLEIAEGRAGDGKENETVYAKYRILDAKTGEEKRGKYFVLKIDAKNFIERCAVRFALMSYADYHRIRGNERYADEVRSYVVGGKR